MKSRKKLLIVQVAALGWDLVQRAPRSSLKFHKAGSVFPALTCPVQASFRTASPPASHGMIANGIFHHDLRKAMFWEQAASLVTGERIWRALREGGGRVGMMFWQQSLGEELDLVFSPAPIHKHGGGMIQDCLANPRELQTRLNSEVGRPFNLMNYWGPLASRKSSDWIVAATKAVMTMPDLAPDLLFSYIPHLDYDLQRHGPGSPHAARALEIAIGYLEELKAHAAANGYDFLFFGDYAMEAAKPGGAIFPNLLLRRAGLLSTRSVKSRCYADLFSARAFAMVDHQVAHVFTRDKLAGEVARQILESTPGVHAVMDPRTAGLAHARSGEWVLVAAEGHWFAYPWWDDPREAPDYATHVDIHNKPGYDPCELFFGWPPWQVSQATGKIRGTHGRVSPELSVAWSSSLNFKDAPGTLIELAGEIRFATRHPR